MRLKRFYDFTMELQGFEEYNSPTYTVVALDELQRMIQYLMDQASLRMVDYCYRLAGEDPVVEVTNEVTGDMESKDQRKQLQTHDLFYGSPHRQDRESRKGSLENHKRITTHINRRRDSGRSTNG